MTTYREKIAEAVAYILKRIPEKPVAGLLTGTGLGESARSLSVSASLSYEEIPHFPKSTVPSHIGTLRFGKLSKQPTIVMQGRFHLYEGYSPLAVTFPIRVIQALGVRTLFVTNAAGGLNPVFKTGDIMIIKDHINLTGANPLVGPNYDDWGDRFPDMTAVYDPELISLAQDAGWKLGLSIPKGVYAGLLGPSLETPAEIRFLTTIGAEAVGFSTVQEVIAAVHAGIRVLGLSIITNVNHPDRPVAASVEEIIQVAQAAAPKVDGIISAVAEAI